MRHTSREPLAARISHARNAMLRAAIVRTLLQGALATLLVLGLGLMLDSLIGLPLPMRRLLVPAAVVAAVVPLLIGVLGTIRAAYRSTDEEVALWFERRIPSLRYALVTSVDPRFAGTVPALEATTAEAPLEAEVAHAARGALTRPAMIVALLLIALLLVPGGAVGRVVAPRPGDALDRAAAGARAATDPLATIVVRITPPPYSALRGTAHDDPSTIAALVGSRIRIEGRGTGVRATVGRDTLRAQDSDGAWHLELSQPGAAVAVRLAGPVRERVLILDPVLDSVPSARLDEPARDSVLRVAQGRVSLVAEVRDDLGLADAAFEFVVSSGAGETFTFRSGRIAERRFASERTARLVAQLNLDTLRLAPGDLIHLRAVARDRNDVTGPGVGASETRTLRIARADEYDSVSVDPMPPTEPEKGALSQRMILMMTEALHAKERRVSRAELSSESRRIGVEQTKLRKRVGEVVFLRLGEDGGEHEHFAGDGHEHAPEGPVNPDQVLAAAERAATEGATRLLESEGDETPIVAINRPLLEAYNHMWRAAGELETANPGAAIPWMRRAIEALQRARAAERIYLRGRPPRVVVDIAKVRGTGKERGASNERAPRAPLDAARSARLARFDAVLDLVADSAAAAADSLLLIRLTLPAEDRPAASALDAAATQVRRGGDATEALARARRALAGQPPRRAPLTLWGM